MIDGISEARQVLFGSLTGLTRKLGGTSSYDGLKEMISKTYRAIELREPQPIPLNEIDEIVQLVDRFAVQEKS